MRSGPKEKPCDNKNCNNTFLQYDSTVKHCSAACYYEDNPSPAAKPRKPIKRSTKKIAPLSGKNKLLEARYQKLRIEFLALPENKYCFIEGCGNEATTIEHRKGRKGYADQAKRDAGIPLKIDVDYFAPCCWECNNKLENDPELSQKYQLSKLHPGQKIKKQSITKNR